MSQNQNADNSIGVSGLLGIVFIALKLTGFINWSWLWVTAPFWIPPLIVAAVLAVFAAGFGIVTLTVFLKNRYENYKNRS